MISIKRDTDEIRDPIIKEYEADLLHRKSQVCFFPVVFNWNLTAMNFRIKAAGPYEDTRTGPNQVLRPNKVPRTGPNQVLDTNCRKSLKGMNRSLEKNYLMSNEKAF